ncbi:MAG: hypothetical protein RL226_2070, partial [Bacteroidota bacterium]
MNKTLVVFCLLWASVMHAQRDVSLKFDLEWDTDEALAELPVGKIGFLGAVWPDELPWYHFQQQVTWSENTEIELVDLVSEAISSEKLTNRQRQLIPNGAPLVESRVVRVGKKRVLQVQILPIWKENGRFYRLISASANPISVAPRRQRSLTWADHSVFAEGTWYKMAIARDGVYRLDRTFLQSLGIDVSSINPQNINIYGNGGEQLPFANSTFRYDDPRKNAIVVAGESDGSFDQNDYILFYGKGPDSWSWNANNERFEHSKHPWCDSAYYYIRIDDVAPLRVSLADTQTGNHNQETAAFTDLQFIENENVNLNRSGREFFGDRFDLTLNITYPFQVPNMLAEPGRLDVS